MRNNEDINLRHTFVGMLFALAIGQAAILFGDLFRVVVYGWDFQISANGFIQTVKSGDYLIAAPIGHLLLGVVLVALSWVGWSQSKAGATYRKIKDVFSTAFLLLIIEVILVIQYFILINSVEIDIKSFMISKELNSAIPSVSAAPEATIMLVIFSTYALWDIISDVFLGRITKKNMPCNKIYILPDFITILTGIITYSGVSIICVVIAWYIQGLAVTPSNPISVFYTDIALIALLFFFRAAKVLEKILKFIFPWEKKRTWEKNNIEARDTGRESPFRPVLMMLISLVIMLFFTCKI